MFTTATANFTFVRMPLSSLDIQNKQTDERTAKQRYSATHNKPSKKRHHDFENREQPKATITSKMQPNQEIQQEHTIISPPLPPTKENGA